MALAETHAGQRRLVYGANVLLNIVLAVALAGLVIWAAGRVGARADLSSAGRNSLWPATVKLLKSLKTDVRITGIYTTALSKVRPFDEKHRNQIRDLLDLYETAGKPRVQASMIDQAEDASAVAEVLARLQKKPAYENEAAPHRAALEAFEEIQRTIVDFAQAELPLLDKLNAETQRRELFIIARNLDSIGKQVQATREEIEQLKSGEVPRYGRAIESLRKLLTDAQSILNDSLKWMSEQAVHLPDNTPAATEFYQSAKQRYAPVIDALQAEIDKIKDLQPVKLESLYEDLKRGQTILIETPEEATVLSEVEVFPWRDQNAPAAPDGDPRRFAGEQEISSALLKLVNKERTGVVFVRFGGSGLLTSDIPPMNPMQPPPEAPLSLLNEMMQRENFVTGEWDVKTSEEPPKLENVVRTIYVVFPPEPPQQVNPMQPPREPGMTPAQKQKVLDAISASGMSLFLTGWMPPRGFSPKPEPYEYADYLKSTWGVDVRSDYVAVQFAPVPQEQGLMGPSNWGREGPVMESSSSLWLTDHAIAQPLGSTPVGLLLTCPLLPVAADQMPAGVKVEPVIEVRESEDIWAIADFNRLRTDVRERMGTRRYDDDLRSPFLLGVAASRADGPQRSVVFSSMNFVTNQALQAARMELAGNALAVVQLYPGNGELFINALHWLTHETDRIAGRPREEDVPRLDRLTDKNVGAVRAFVVGVWPVLALAVGAAVWLVRRR